MNSRTGAASVNTTAVRQFSAMPHPRVPWTQPGCDPILVHGRLSVLRGSEQGLGPKRLYVREIYGRAKTQNDMEAASELVDLLWRPAALDTTVERIVAMGRRPLVLSPHPAFDDDDAIDADAGDRPHPRNAIPFAFAERVRRHLNGLPDETIVQAARVGRTKLKNFPRFLCQPRFEGEVSTDRPYILVDDVVTLGGTLAALRSHIVRAGGTVIGVTALAHKNGRDIAFALSETTARELAATFGTGLKEFWQEATGHEYLELTEQEARFLLEWSRDHCRDLPPVERLHALRDRLLKARGTGE